MLRFALCATLLNTCALALADTTITYQGQLHDKGQPYTGPVGVVFTLYDSETGTDELAEISRSVEVADGLFQTTLDFGNQPYASGLWMEITVNGVTLDDRQALSAVPLALSVPPNSIGSTEIAPGAIGSGEIDTSQLQQRVTGSCVTSTAIQTVESDGSVSCSEPFWSTNGNELAGGEYIGTTNNQAFEIRTNGSRHLRIEPATDDNGDPIEFEGEIINANIIGGSPANSVAPGVRGAVISGGGVPEGGDPFYTGGDKPNRIFSLYSTIGGGLSNSAGTNGQQEIITSAFATVSGGLNNTASAPVSTIGGGSVNTALGNGSVVAGGSGNEAHGLASTVPGGISNCAGSNYSFAAGQRAKVRVSEDPGDGGACSGLPSHGDDRGTFIWADSQNSDFVSSGSNQFLIRAQNGVAINTNHPNGRDFRVNGSAQFDDLVQFNGLGSGNTTDLCLNSSGILSDCNASSRQLKEDIAPIAHGLGLLEELRAVTFRWKDTGQSDIGLIAEEVAKVEPRLATYDEAGQVKGVRYRQLAVVLLAALQEHSAAFHGDQSALSNRIDALEAENAELREQVASLARKLPGSRELQERIATLEDLLLSDLRTSQAGTVSHSK